MKHLVFATVGAIVGVLAMMVHTFTLEYSEAEQATVDCLPTEMYAINAGRKMHIYDCSSET